MVKELGEISSLLEELLATQRLRFMEVVENNFCSMMLLFLNFITINWGLSWQGLETFPQNVQSGSGAHPASCFTGTRVLFLR